MHNDSANAEGVQRVRVGPVSSFVDGRSGGGGGTARQLVKCGTRNIAVFYHREQFYAIDNACYHHGGPLLHGDMEDMGSHVCIVCPWHRYCIALDTGEGLYMGLAPSTPAGNSNNSNKAAAAAAAAASPMSKMKPVVCSKGRKQRVHRVVVEDGVVYVCVDVRGPALESDVYANMPMANSEAAMTQPVYSAAVGSGGCSSSGNMLHSRMGAPAWLQQRQQQQGALPPPSGHVFQGLARVPRVAAVGSSTSSSSSSAVLCDAVSVAVSCCAVVDVCCAVRALTLTPLRHDNDDGDALRRVLRRVPAHVLLGDSVELELPVHDGDDEGNAIDRSRAMAATAAAPVLMRRTYTICNVHTPAVHTDNNNINKNSNNDDNDDDVRLTILVKSPLPSSTTTQTAATTTTTTRVTRSGTAWLYTHASSTPAPLRVCRIGGAHCVLARHLDKLRRCGGRVLWLTAGIGATSAYAAAAAVQPHGVLAAAPQAALPLHVVHLHVDRTTAHVAMLSAFLQWHTRGDDESSSHGSSYCFHLILTRQETPATADVTDGDTTGHARMDEQQQQMLRRVAVTYGRRPVDADIANAVHTSFATARFVAFVCGPVSFVRFCFAALRRLGVSAEDMITDELV